MGKPEPVPYKLHEDQIYVVAYIEDGEMGLTQIGSYSNKAAVDRFTERYPKRSPFRVLCLDRMKVVRAVSSPGFEVVR